MKILVTLGIPEIGIELMRNQGLEVTVWTGDKPLTQAALIEQATGHDALLSMGVDRIDAYFLQQCKHLKMISQFAAGYDNIDVAAATELNIPVANAPDAMTEATADIAFALILAVSRKVCYMHKSIINGNWGHFRPKANLGLELKNKTLGVFGLGRIGTALAQRCQGAYGMEVLYCNRHQNLQAEQELRAQKVSFEDLLKKSDILSVHCSLNETTTALFDQKAFSQMKSSAIFINTARGSIHQEDDLTAALQAGEIWGPGLDVTSPEPMKPDHPLLSMEQVAVLPHIGSATVEARNEMSRVAAENLVLFSKNAPITNLVNPAVYRPN